MSEPKPTASLSSALLARKGHARPAMRPQGFTHFGSGAAQAIDDLGWNDMGDQPAARTADAPAPRTADVVPISPAAPAVVAPVEAPMVHRQREEIAREMAPSAEPTPDPVVEAGERRRDDRIRNKVDVEIERAAKPRAAHGSKSKAAFTLRLDGERHLKLRLAGAVAHRSSQAIVIDALDAYLETLPRVAELARDAARRSDAAHVTQLKDKR